MTENKGDLQILHNMKKIFEFLTFQRNYSLNYFPEFGFKNEIKFDFIPFLKWCDSSFQ